MKILTRAQAIKNLQKYIGMDLADLAEEHGITTYKNGKQNKGWKGLVLERLAGLSTNNTKAPNGLTYELKSVSFYEVGGVLIPRETMAITMINQKELIEQTFFQSHLWNKLKSIIFCAVMWNGYNAKKAEFLRVTSFDFLQTDDLIREVEQDYDFIRNKLISEGFSSLTGKYGKWIQPRTKGAGHGSTSRAFYARKILIKRILEL